MTAQQMWEAYIRKYPEAAGESYDAWSFGSEQADLLAQLTAEGIKTATASAYALYEYENEELPRAGEYSVILRTDETAACVIRTSRVFLTPFNKVTEQQAWREGEGDRSLAYWRQVHKAFFAEELRQAGLAFSDEMIVVCEEFEVVFPV